MNCVQIKYGLGVSTTCFLYNQADSWQKLNYHSLLATYSPSSGHEKLKKLEMVLKLAILKKRNRDQRLKSMQTS